MKRITYLLIVLLIVAGGKVAGQERLTLRQCMEIAVENSSKIKTQATEIEDARMERRAAILGTFTPQIAGGTGAAFSFGRAVDPETNTYRSITSFNNSYSVGGTFVLFDGFSAINNLRTTKTALKMGYTREEQLRDEIALATMEAFFNVVFNEELVAVFEGFVQTAKTNLQLASRQKDLGQKGYADVVQFEAELADREYDLVNARNNCDLAMMTLKDIMLYPVDQDLAIEADTQAISETATPSYGETADFARQNQPSILLAEGKLNNAKRELNTAKWSLFPSLSMSGGWSTSYYSYDGQQTPNFRSQFKGNRGEFVQFNLSIPIFGGLIRHAKIAKAKHAFKRAEIAYEQTLHDVDQEVSRAIREHEGARAALNQAEKRAVVQEEAYRLNQSKLERGLISSLEFQTASNQYLKSRAERMDALLKFRLKQSVVKYYQGQSYIDQN